MKYLLDTCYISEFIKSKPNKYALDWIDEHLEDELYISVLTVGELQKGIDKQKDQKRRKNLARWFENVKNQFKDKILSVDENISLRWGAMTAKLEKQGRTVPVVDLLIASTALEHSMTVVTRNDKDFADTGVIVVNPFVI